MNSETLSKLHRCQVEMLDFIDEFCRKNNLTYYLIGGTLLGAVRHQGFIPWDDDVDIAMPRKDYEFFEKHIVNELGEKYFFQTCFTDKYYGRDFSKLRMNNTVFLEHADAHVENRHHGIFIDIFILEDSPKRRKGCSHLKFRAWQILDSYIVLKRGKIDIPANKKFLNLFPIGFLLRMRDWCKKGKGDCYFLSAAGIEEKSSYYPPKKLSFEGKEYLIPCEYEKILTSIYGDYMKLPPIDERVTHNPVRISFDVGGQDEKI